MVNRKSGHAGLIISIVALGPMQFRRGIDDGLAELDQASDPGVPYPRWMVLQLGQVEDPRPKILEPSRFLDGGTWRDLRGRKR